MELGPVSMDELSTERPRLLNAVSGLLSLASSHWAQGESSTGAIQRRHFVFDFARLMGATFRYSWPENITLRVASPSARKHCPGGCPVVEFIPGSFDLGIFR